MEEEVPANAKNPAESIPLIWLPARLNHPWVIAAIFGMATFACTGVLDWFMLRTQRWMPLATSVVSNGIFAVIVTLLFFRLMMHGEQRRKQVRQRLATIDEMNHHIRNALQVISFNVRPASRNDFELAEIGQALNRIQWALREIVPKLEPEFTPFEGSARLHKDHKDGDDHGARDLSMADRRTLFSVPVERASGGILAEISDIVAPLYQVFIVIGASILLAIAARFTLPLPFTPIPLTLQNFAVLLVALTLGRWRGFAAVALYVAEGAAGLPIFTGGSFGLTQLFGPTGGYLLAYPIVAFVAGAIVDRNRPTFARALLACITAEVLLFIAGVGYLVTAMHIPLAEASGFGLYPFIFAEVMKVTVAAAIARRIRR